MAVEVAPINIHPDQIASLGWKSVRGGGFRGGG
jgi:hypothetical protein